MERRTAMRIHKGRFVMRMVGLFLLAVGGVVGVLAGISAIIQFGQSAGDLAGPACLFDEEAPVITLNGEPEMTLVAGRGVYEELGATAVDACGEVPVEISGEVDAATEGTYRVFYTAVDEWGNETKVRRKVTVKPYNGTIYLTFDDGPGEDTARLLDILARYNVKVTFFVTGRGDDALITREYNEGHAVGLHTLSHDYAYVYRSVDNFFADLIAVQQRVESATGGYVSTLMRFPGGSSNTVSRRYDGGSRIMSRLVGEVEARGFSYFDWNVDSNDAVNGTTTEDVYNNIVAGLKWGGESVVLQHDIKSFSIDAVERVIEYAASNGFVFDKLTPTSFGAHHGANN